MKLSDKIKDFIDQCNRIDINLIDHTFLMKYKTYFFDWTPEDFQKHIPYKTRAKIHKKWDKLYKEAIEQYSDLCLTKRYPTQFLLPGIGFIYFPKS